MAGALALAVSATAGARPGAAAAPPPAFVVAAAMRQAAALGDPHPAAAQYVLTHRRAAVEAGSGATVVADERAYLIILTGRFRTGAVGPSPGHVVTGTYATDVLDAATGLETDSSVGRQPVATASLGPVGDLLPYMEGTARPACAAPDLAASAAFQGATQSELGGIGVRNRSGLACTLPASPQVALSWRGRPLAVTTTLFPPRWLERMNPRWAQRVRVLAPGARAQVIMQWFNWCGATPWGRGRGLHLTVALHVPHQPVPIEATTAELVVPPFCNLRPRTGIGSALHVSPFVETS